MKSVAIDNRLQNLTHSERAIDVCLVEASSPLSPLMIARVVHIENELKRSQSFGVEALDATLKVMPSRLDDTGPFDWVFHMLVERHASQNKGLELADEMRRSLLQIALDDRMKASSSERSKTNVLGVLRPAVFE